MNFVMIALNSGGVMVSREVLVGASDEDFMRSFEKFQKAHSSMTCTFFTEKELDNIQQEIQKAKYGRS